MRHFHLTHGILLLALLPASVTFADSAAELLEQGIYKEETAGDLDGAIAIYGRIVANSKASRPLVARAQFRLGMCQLKKGEKRKAAGSFERVQSRFADQKGPAKAAADQLRKLEPVAKGSLDSSYPLVLRTVPPTYANDVSASLTQIVVRFDRRMMDKSWSWTGGGETFPKTTGKPHYDRSRKDPTNANAWNGLGWSQFNQGSPLVAKLAFQRCLEAEPKHAAALNGLGWIAKSQGKTDEAITHWQAAVAAAPGATAALAGLCRTYMEQENYAEAIRYYELWVGAEPNNKDAKTGLAKAKAAIE